MSEVFTKALDHWERAATDCPITQMMFPMEYREAWVELFVKYNTPLPSSAAVERLFSTGGDILRAKRSSLTAKNFEHMMFMRCNMDLLSFKEDKEDMDAE